MTRLVRGPIQDSQQLIGVRLCTRTGARPVFADIDPDRLTLDPAAVDAAVPSRTRTGCGPGLRPGGTKSSNR